MKICNCIGREPICNHNPQRAPKIGRFCFILCWRCTGLCLGIFIGALVNYFYNLINLDKKIIICVVMIIPCFIDGMLQYKTKYESNNYKRFLLGIIAGIGIGMITQIFSFILMN